ncbi:hypothetical protein ACS0TY_010972 [Phlomoides rotata]
MLQKLGFSSSFQTLVGSVLQSARLTILINGSHMGYFACSRGVRKGDPLSPPPFLYC